jgi:hypothetical protein
MEDTVMDRSPYRYTRDPRLLALLATALTVCISFAADVAPTSAPAASAQEQQQQRLELMASRGADASLTILPIKMPNATAGSPIPVRVAEVFGLFLERAGLKEIEIGTAAFDPTNGDDLTRTATQLGDFLVDHPITTNYALYAEFHADVPKRAFDEIRAVVVDNTGAIVWIERWSVSNNADQSKQPVDPMAMSMMLSQRLGPKMGLNEQTAKAAKPGNMAMILDQRSGLPSEAERAAIAPRQAAMKETRSRSTMLVFAPRVADHQPRTTDAVQLAKLITDAALCKSAVAAYELPKLKSPTADPNELKRLWEFARQCQTYVRDHHPDADYLLFADYAFSAADWQRGMVHFVVCDRSGDWVIVDMQNSHHPDFQSIKPTSTGDCDRLLVKRLESIIKR